MKIATYDSSKIAEIKQLFIQTFSDSEGVSEGLLVGSIVYDLIAFTKECDLYGFVATEDDQMIGSIFFSKLTFESEVRAFLLSPVATLTNYQGKGVGQKLIRFGLAAMKELGAELVFTYGDPAFYAKVGFLPIDEKRVKAPFKLSQPEGWLGQALIADQLEPIRGNSHCVEALNKQEYW